MQDIWELWDDETTHSYFGVFLDFGLVLGEPNNEIMRLRMKMKKMKTKPFIQFSWSSIGQN